MMKNNKMNRIGRYSVAMQGFTLIEFLVASVLAMIVIMAASGTYLITRRLNHTVQQRISTQQDIRNASVQIARDARMAGSFGCFNTASTIDGKSFDKIEAKNATGVVRSNNTPIVSLDPERKDGYGVRLIAKEDLRRLQGVTNPSDGLLFIYGQSATATNATLMDYAGFSNPSAVSKVTELDRIFFNKEIANGTTSSTTVDDSDVLKRVLENKKGDVILSTCSEIVRIAGINSFENNTLKIQETEIRASEKHVGELSLSKLHASLYVLGDINRSGRQWADEKALLRYDLGADGAWQNPQLLATGIKNMSFSFGYVNDTAACKNEITSASNSETFDFFDKPSSNTAATQPPALVQVRLKYYANKATGNPSDAKIRDYIINTTVRAGNTCANRLVKS